MPNFALIGAAGYIAPRHMEAIHAIGGILVAVVDPHDSVGILDRYFPKCLYFREFERFDRFVDTFNRRNGQDGIHYVVVSSPNYLHDAHCRWALVNGMDVICEKPPVLREKNLDRLLRVEEETGKHVHVVVQARLHPEIQRAALGDYPRGSFNVTVDYHSPRGAWYHQTWKGDLAKSGGLAANIGFHFFDIVCWIFGKPSKMEVFHNNKICRGTLQLDRAQLAFILSIGPNDRNKPRRRIFIGKKEIDFTNGFEDLHTEYYRRITVPSGLSWGLEDVRYAVRITEAIRRKGH